MITNKNLVNKLFQKSLRPLRKIQRANIMNRYPIGNRDWVCFGRSGAASYTDDVSFPFPSVRFKENSNELLALREKEKGDWRKLSCEEKKILYRASFRQTFSEMLAPTGEWKSVVGISFFLLSFGVWLYIGQKLFVTNARPRTLTEEYRAKMLRRMLDLKMGHLTGVSSKWDYEAEKWK